MKYYGSLNDSRGAYTVRVTLQDGAFKGSFTYEILSNAGGLSILQSFDIEDEMPLLKTDKCEIEILDDGDYRVILTDPQGDTLETECDSSDFHSMVVALEIVDFKEADKL